MERNIIARVERGNKNMGRNYEIRLVEWLSSEGLPAYKYDVEMGKQYPGPSLVYRATSFDDAERAMDEMIALAESLSLSWEE